MIGDFICNTCGKQFKIMGEEFNIDCTLKIYDLHYWKPKAEYIQCFAVFFSCICILKLLKKNKKWPSTGQWYAPSAVNNDAWY